MQRVQQNLDGEKRHSYIFFVCVTEQHYVSIFFTRLWSVGKALISDIQNPEVSGFLDMRMRIDTKPNGKQT